MTMVLRPGEAFDELVAGGNRGCPRCGGTVARWGRGRWRVVRAPGGEQRVQPHRVRCVACGVTHIVLPPDLLVRRRDAVVVVGRAWRFAAAGVGARRVARELGLPLETVRGWLRRLRAVLAVRYGTTAGNSRGRLQRGLADVEADAAVSGWRDDQVWLFASFRSQGALLSNTS
jgi:hypothetical protein